MKHGFQLVLWTGRKIRVENINIFLRFKKAYYVQHVIRNLNVLYST